MAIVTCTTCCGLVWRPDEMVGTAWQCPTCGPTKVSRETQNVPALLAELLEREYKMVVWGTPSASRPQAPDPRRQPSSEADPQLAALSFRLPTISEERVRQANPRPGLLWVTVGCLLSGIILLFLGLTLAPTKHRPVLVLLGAFLAGGGASIGSVILVLMLILDYTRHRRFNRRALEAAGLPSPRSKIDPLKTCEAFTPKMAADQLSAPEPDSSIKTLKPSDTKA